VTVGKAGFGTFLVERLIAQHNGEAEMEYGPRGITWTMTFPAQQPPVTEAVCAAILQDQTHPR
jgi:two-component sensor histidine kinase